MSRSSSHFIHSKNRNVNSNTIRHNIIRWSLSLFGWRTTLILTTSMLVTDSVLLVINISILSPRFRDMSPTTDVMSLLNYFKIIKKSLKLRSYHDVNSHKTRCFSNSTKQLILNSFQELLIF